MRPGAARSRIAWSTTSGTSSHIHGGRLAMSIPARAWNSVRVKPGHDAVTRTPVPARSCASPSLKTVTHDLAAE